MLRLVHLSDIHLDKSTLNDAETFIFKALEKDLIEFNSKKQIDVIAISGDLVDKGGKSFDGDLQLALLSFEEVFIDNITTSIDLPKHRVFFSPGNHDLNKTADDDIIECGLVKKLVNTKSVNDFIDSANNLGLNRISDFKDFEASFFNKFDGEHELSKFQSCFKFTYNELSIGINCLNSSWRCWDSNTDKNQIILGERQLTNPRSLIGDCDVKIALMHHPIDWLNKFDQRDIKNIIARDYQMLLCGHVHEGESWSRTDQYGSIFVSVAPSNWTYNLRSTDKETIIGYSIIDFDLANLEITNHFRRYSKPNEKFVPNVDLGNDEGAYQYPIPAKGAIIKISKEIETAGNIESLHFEIINEHLLSFNTDTKAPKNINDIFVMPKIVEKFKYEIESEDTKTGKDEKETVYSLKDICSTNKNLLVFGTKESGKTILLDKILIEITSNVEKYNKIPVLIDFEDLGSKRFETIISRFLKLNIHDIPNFLKDHSVVLLIDNLNFHKPDKQNLMRLEKFIEKHPNIKTIATSYQMYEGDIPLELLRYPFLSTFSHATIKSFSIREIKGLVKNWFKNNESYNNPLKVDNLIKVLLALNLPRSPLAISMFLWILEQHEKYKPINHATMLENFIERIFKKQSKNEIYSDVFDYKNKERLLTEIAAHMLTANRENYKVSLTDLMSFVNDYLKAKRFDDFSTEDILQHLFEKGILVKEYDGVETFARFRFTCFFQYFLTKKMIYDDDFKKFVLQEDQYLKFHNEIEYYTGLQRDESEVLKLIVGRMNSDYNDILKDICSFKYGFDQMFIADDSMIDKIDASKLIEHISNGKPDEHQIDEVKDKILDGIKPEKGIENKENDIHGIKKLDLLWCLSAQILKNTEETSIKNIKDDSYRDIIRCSMAFGTVYKYKLDQLFNDPEQCSKINKEMLNQLKIQHNFLPFIHQVVLRYLMGSRKLSAVIRDKIKLDSNSSDTSDFERFLSVFLYADLEGMDSISHIKSFIKSIKHRYMFDMTLYKLTGYYYFRSDSKDSDNLYQNLIADLIIKSKKKRKIEKGEIITNFIEKKRKRLKDDDDLAN